MTDQGEKEKGVSLETDQVVLTTDIPCHCLWKLIDVVFPCNLSGEGGELLVVPGGEFTSLLQEAHRPCG